MIVETRNRLESWVAVVAGDVTCSAGAPGSDDPADVLLYLMCLTPRAEVRHMRRSEPMRIGLRYLVVTQGNEAEQRLERLLDAALRQDDFEVDLTPLSPETWVAFGSPPRPAFVIDIEATVVREQRAGPAVLHQLAVDVAPSSPLRGEVLGPGRIPIPGARVEVVGMHQIAYTDGQGHFEFSSVPDATSTKLRVSARGREFLTMADAPDRSEPIVIICNILEEG